DRNHRQQLIESDRRLSHGRLLCGLVKAERSVDHQLLEVHRTQGIRVLLEREGHAASALISGNRDVVRKQIRDEGEVRMWLRTVPPGLDTKLEVAFIDVDWFLGERDAARRYLNTKRGELLRE